MADRCPEPGWPRNFKDGNMNINYGAPRRGTRESRAAVRPTQEGISRNMRAEEAKVRGSRSAQPARAARSPVREAAPAGRAHPLQATARQDPDAIRHAFETGEIPTLRSAEKNYLDRMLPLQAELLKAQNWVKETGEQIVVLFEGRDAAGKGGMIKRFIEHLNPRETRIVALEKPSSASARMVFPALHPPPAVAQEQILFNRSWYNRAGVERVMGFCTRSERNSCFGAALEQMLARSGIRLFKYWFSVSARNSAAGSWRRDRSAQAVEASPIDKASLDKWDAYTEAKEAMFFNTDTPTRPGPSSSPRQEARAHQLHECISCAALPYDSKDHHTVVGAGPADRGFVAAGARRIDAYSRRVGLRAQRRK